MILVADLGNSRIKWGRVAANARNGEALEEHEGIRYGEEGLDHTLESAWGELETPKAVVYCAVAPEAVVSELVHYVSSRWHLRPHRLAPTHEAHGVVCAYDEPRQLGADRWAALAGARAMCPNSGAIVVDAGTAITVDALSQDGVHIGGVIMPGVRLMRRALGEGTARIGSVGGGEVNLETHNTASAVATGTVLGAASAVDRVVADYAARLGSNPRLLLTGGETPLVDGASTTTFEIVPDLVLRGLCIAARAIMLEQVIAGEPPA
ncbi:MAG: type III pantothenate kinase [Gammaproteobacteria bacterium]|jgi:type III pantothenate kinase